MKTEIVKAYDGGWTVQFSFNNQYFRLNLHGSNKREAMWHMKMLKIMFKAYDKDVVKRKCIPEITHQMQTDLDIPEHQNLELKDNTN